MDRKGQKPGKFFNERRFLVPHQESPGALIQAFVSAGGGRFFEQEEKALVEKRRKFRVIMLSV